MDRFAGGDYIISARHTDTLYRISAVDGSIIWQLGGKTSDFTQNYNFSYQHDPRILSENSTTTIISLFDNAYNGFNGSSLFSTGKIIAIDNTTMTSTLLQNYTAPDPSGGLVSASQGNIQVLPNGNVFSGWGSQAYVTEFAADGTPVFYAHFATTGALHYRAYKFNFTSSPVDAPALYTYSRNHSSSTAYYVSWNGATEVASWTFYSGQSADNLTLVGNTKKVGFETVSTTSEFYQFSMAEAVAANGTGLRNSTIVGTFVPGSQLADSCTDTQCPLVDGSMFELAVQSLGATPTAPPPMSLATGSDSGTGTASSTATSEGSKHKGWGLLRLVGFVGLMLLGLL